MRKRRSGILLHISSLPGQFGIGDFGPSAYQFADFLEASGQTVWQILPLSATIPKAGYSPYSSPSAFAINPMFVSPELLVKAGLLADSDINIDIANNSEVNFRHVAFLKEKLLKKAHINFQKNRKNQKSYQNFITKNADWLDDFAMFMVLKMIHYGKSWDKWPKSFRMRDDGTIRRAALQYQDLIAYHKFVQFILWQQWQQLRKYCKSKNIKIFGDIPIYVVHDSVDVWANPKLFKLTPTSRPEFIAGTPPDFFSETGQRWGNPVFNWKNLKKQNYNWWVRRFMHNLELFDFIRIDHFRGFVKYWEIPAKNRTAKNGKWTDVPTYDFFDTVFSLINKQRIIAEDLGEITDDVIEAIDKYNLPGMKVLVFAFEDNLKKNIHLPHNYPKHSVVYTGTHDNNTVQGWFKHEITVLTRKKVKTYYTQSLDKQFMSRHVNWALIELAMHSKAFMAITPLQDLLNLDEMARMNYPGKPKGNWAWRCKNTDLAQQLASKLLRLTQLTKRV